MSTWFDNKTHQEVIDSKLFPLMMKSIGTAGINGLDRLISFMILTELQSILQYLDRNFTKDKVWPQMLLDINENIEAIDGKITGFLRYILLIYLKYNKPFITPKPRTLTESSGQL